MRVLPGTQIRVRAIERTEQLPEKSIGEIINFTLALKGTTSRLRGMASVRIGGSDFIGQLLLCLRHSACQLAGAA